MSYVNDEDDLARLSVEDEANEKQGMELAVKVSAFAVPVVLIHLLIIYMFISAVTGWNLSSVVTEIFLPFFWVTGGLIGFAIFYWRKGGFPIADRIRLTGWRARYMIAAFILVPFASFIAPQMIAELLRRIAFWFQ
ncbi:hypothetical protein C1T17_14875 [Sphingobium sp. SCG-1]|uniref:hypothetical protein n=1 Tax=Sphingobium sp. SCG-1 TaxID=2072936 RepID=UPI000CD6BEDF|nr:hypothetical protein [Sphingobium sp. SCG-1]AUW59179.1 hypothetical protein C1T17_14875 [Sphingobium sp. SCG-1]